MITNLIPLVLLLLAAIVIVSIASLIFKTVGEAGGARYEARIALLSSPEQQLYWLLVKALPEHVVMAQVAFSRILMTRGGDSKENFSKFGRAKQKVADFVVCSKDFKMLAVIELDDSSHSRDKDERRDAMLREAGLRTMRWNVRGMPDTAEIRRALLV